MADVNLKGKKILITGGTSFIGRNLIDKLKSSGAHLINVSKSRRIEGIDNISIDLTETDFSFLDDLNLDYIVHLAACSSPRRSKSDEETLEINYEATKKLFEKITSLGSVKKTIFLSSSIVYRDNKDEIKEESELDTEGSSYARSKILAENAAKQLIKKGFGIIVFRMSNSYGPYQQWEEDDMPTLIPQLISDAILKGKVNVQDGKPVRDYIYVMDVVSAIIRGLTSSYSGILNLGTGIGTSSGDIANFIGESVGCPVVDLGVKSRGPESVILDIAKLKKELSFKPEYNIKEGLPPTIKYYEGTIRK